jgi:hypothetical protein
MYNIKMLKVTEISKLHKVSISEEFCNQNQILFGSTYLFKWTFTLMNFVQSMDLAFMMLTLETCTNGFVK